MCNNNNKKEIEKSLNKNAARNTPPTHHPALPHHQNSLSPRNTLKHFTVISYPTNIDPCAGNALNNAGVKPR